MNQITHTYLILKIWSRHGWGNTIPFFMGVATRAGKLLGILGQDPSGSKARFTLGVEAKGQGKSHDPIG